MSEQVTTYAYAHGLAAHPSGPGAYGLLVVTPTGRSRDQRAYRHSTKDRMAIAAATAALRHCPRGSTVELHLGNRRVYDAIAAGRLKQWRLDNWRARVGGRPIKDADLWKELDKAFTDRQVSVVLANPHDEAFADCVRRARLANASPLKHTDPTYHRRPAPKSVASRPKTRQTRILVDGDPCPRCQTAVTHRSVKGQVRKPGQRFYWDWILRCKACGARYQTREGRRRIDPESSPPAIAQKAT
ncbi:ribonuclease H [Planctomycetes bacterium MalM25]|nr:ribonuclease H [Planctomycetes bacterium MalM25]